jgi:hypothetical protein
MKTPREILLQNHRDVERKLDELRQQVIARTLNIPESNPQERVGKRPASPKQPWLVVWQELVRPSRHIWTGIAAVWVILLAVNQSMTESARTSKRASAHDRAMVLQSFVEERKLLAELLQPESKPAPPQTDPAPSPRSKRAISEKRKVV